MRGMLAVLLFTLLTAICWGVYGPVLHQGQHDMQGSSLRPFVCVGLAYMLIAVITPLMFMKMRGETGAWTPTGIFWSIAAGAAGAIGALGVIMAFRFGGSPLYVMPLVFGGAPVVNTFTTMTMNRSYREAGPVFFAGLILVITGVATVLLFKPSGANAGPANEMTLLDWAWVAGSILVAVLSWGVYGPVLHKGQLAMRGSRLRPLVCVGISYFLIAVLAAGIFLSIGNEPGQFTWSGSAWSLLGGATGAIGALGIIMAFTFGGKPIYVMPLVFGGAPVINTFTTMTQYGSWGQADPIFYAGLLLVIAGAVTVLLFAPKGAAHPAPAAS